MTATLQVGLNEPLTERLRPAHQFMLSLVEAAEDLGYGVVSVSTGSVTLAHGSDVEITVSGYMVTGDYLRRTLRPVKA